MTVTKGDFNLIPTVTICRQIPVIPYTDFDKIGNSLFLDNYSIPIQYTSLKDSNTSDKKPKMSRASSFHYTNENIKIKNIVALIII